MFRLGFRVGFAGGLIVGALIMALFVTFIGTAEGAEIYVPEHVLSWEPEQDPHPLDDYLGSEMHHHWLDSLTQLMVSGHWCEPDELSADTGFSFIEGEISWIRCGNVRATIMPDNTIEWQDDPDVVLEELRELADKWLSAVPIYRLFKALHEQQRRVEGRR